MVFHQEFPFLLCKSYLPQEALLMAKIKIYYQINHIFELTDVN